MERLTERTTDGILVKENHSENGLRTFYQCFGGKPNANYSNCEEGYCAMEKLAAYEDAEEQCRILPAPLDGVERFTLDGGKTIWQRVYEPDMTEEGTAMTENEAKDILNEIMELDDSMAQYNLTYMKAMEVAIKALGEVQQYRKYKNKFREIYGDCEDALDVMLDLLTKYEMPELNGKADYKLRLLTDKDADKWDAYRTIGTPEECRAWKEKQNAKKVISFDYNNGTVNYGCPVCKRKIISKIDGKWCGGTFNEYCDRCGQKLDWRDEE